jgi:predicted HicB family RNase H-like nuclease
MPKNGFNFDNPIDNVLEELSSNQDTSRDERFYESQINNIQKTPIKEILTEKKTKFNENNKELKQKRHNLKIIPSLYKDIEKIAYVEKISANEAINRAIELYCKKNKNKLGLYSKIEEIKANNES